MRTNFKDSKITTMSNIQLLRMIVMSILFHEPETLTKSPAVEIMTFEMRLRQIPYTAHVKISAVQSIIEGCSGKLILSKILRH